MCLPQPIDVDEDNGCTTDRQTVRQNRFLKHINIDEDNANSNDGQSVSKNARPVRGNVTNSVSPRGSSVPTIQRDNGRQSVAVQGSSLVSMTSALVPVSSNNQLSIPSASDNRFSNPKKDLIKFLERKSMVTLILILAFSNFRNFCICF